MGIFDSYFNPPSEYEDLDGEEETEEEKEDARIAAEEAQWESDTDR